MLFRLAVVTTLIGTLGGCAYPGHDGLLRDANQVEYSYKGDKQALADCLTEKFNNESFSMTEIGSPVTTSLQKASSIQLISGFNQVWAWSIELKTVQGGTAINADIRKDVNPYFSNHYMLDKVDRYLGECGAAFAEPKV